MTPDDVISSCLRWKRNSKRKAKSLSLNISNACAMTYTNDCMVSARSYKRNAILGRLDALMKRIVTEECVLSLAQVSLTLNYSNVTAKTGKELEHESGPTSCNARLIMLCCSLAGCFSDSHAAQT